MRHRASARAQPPAPAGVARPINRTAASALGRALRPAALRSLRGWRHGALSLHLPGGERVLLGDPAAAERAVVRVADDRLFSRLVVRGELGAGEGYVAGDWDADDLVTALRLFCRNLPALALESPLTAAGRLVDRARHLWRRNSRRGSRRNIGAHYDLGNDFYRLILDDSLTYSCAIFSPGDDLAAAQRRKIDALLDDLAVGPGDHLLDVGCGWGALALRAAITRGCRVTAITVSRAQHDLARARVAAAGLAERVDVRLCDYRDVTGRYDALVSVEMLEAIGHRYLDAFFARCAALLRPGGRLALQTITVPDARYDAYRRGVDWTQTYVFPGCHIPSPGAVARAAAAAGLRVVSSREIGPHYAPTLRAWRHRFTAQRDAISALGHDDRFLRTFTLYLSFSEAAFAERTLGDAQLVLTRDP
jgi:cyclopropane-fatty-acyl-phospholipid synthase